MNTTVIDHLSRVEDFSGPRVRKAFRLGSPVRRFRNLIELSDWDERVIRHAREIDVFCWMLALGAALLLIPVSFLVMKG